MNGPVSFAGTLSAQANLPAIEVHEQFRQKCRKNTGTILSGAVGEQLEHCITNLSRLATLVLITE
jgi:hypothetical protein